jgi:hypothetical protein
MQLAEDLLVRAARGGPDPSGKHRTTGAAVIIEGKTLCRQSQLRSWRASPRGHVGPIRIRGQTF